MSTTSKSVRDGKSTGKSFRALSVSGEIGPDSKETSNKGDAPGFDPLRDTLKRINDLIDDLDRDGTRVPVTPGHYTDLTQGAEVPQPPVDDDDAPFVDTVNGVAIGLGKIKSSRKGP